MLETCDEGFEWLKAQMGGAAPTASVGGGATASPVVARSCGPADGAKVVAFLSVGDNCIIRMHQNGSLCFIRRRGKPEPGVPRFLCWSRQATQPPLPAQPLLLLRYLGDPSLSFSLTTLTCLSTDVALAF